MKLIRSETTLRLAVGVVLVLAATVVGVAWAAQDDPLDPAHNLALPCEAVSTPGAAPRSAKNIVHVANVCGFVGTDVEFQSRTASDGVRDYAFVGTMGGGLRIFDVTNPTKPSLAGSYTDPGWQGDVQVRGDLAVIGFDPIGGVNPSTSVCLQGKGASGGVDIVRLTYDSATANFQTALIDCVSASPGGGAHNSTLHPSGDWLAMVNPRTNGSVDVVDLAGPGTPKRVYRIVQTATLAHSSCAGAAAGQCISNGRPGTWSPHDVSFSRDGTKMYVAAVGNDTVIVDVSGVLSGSVSTIGVVPNDRSGGGVANDRHDLEISHQSDTSSDGAILGITDERGGGTGETRCNTDPNGVIGGIHFWKLPVTGVATESASRLGAWFYPNPTWPWIRSRRSSPPSGAPSERARSMCSAWAATAPLDRARSHRASTASHACRAASSPWPTTAPASGTSTSAAPRARPTASPRTRAARGATPSGGASCQAPRHGRRRSTRATSTQATCPAGSTSTA